jgi:adenylate kinase family enzyme
MRVIVMGNSGSGKSTLAIGISEKLGIPRIALDQLYWEPGGFTRERPAETVAAEITDLSSGPEWVVEGVYTDLIARFAGRATDLIWLDLDWPLIEQNLTERGFGTAVQGSGAASDETFQRLMGWARDYWNRDDSYSWNGHSEIFHRFSGTGLRIRSREEADRFLDDLVEKLTNRTLFDRIATVCRLDHGEVRFAIFVTPG